MDILLWVLIKGSYVSGILLLFALMLTLGFGVAALGSALLRRSRDGGDITGSVMLNLLASLVFGVLLAIATSDASGDAASATGVFLTEMWNGFAAQGLSQVANSLFILLTTFLSGLGGWAEVLSTFFDSVAADLDDRGNFVVFFVPSILCLTALIIRDLRSPSSHGRLAAAGHIAVFMNFTAIAAFVTWLLMATWVAVLILVLLTGLFSTSPTRYVVLRV